MTKEGRAALWSTVIILCLLGYVALVLWKAWIVACTFLGIMVAGIWYEIYRYYIEKEEK